MPEHHFSPPPWREEIAFGRRSKLSTSAKPDINSTVLSGFAEALSPTYRSIEASYA